MKLGTSLLLLSLATTHLVSCQDIPQLHGSGTTNPSKCYWHIMDQFHVQTKDLLRLTYRAVGSTTGQAEFMGANVSIPDNDFGSGDIPLSADQYNELTSAGIEVVQFPVVMGAVSFFHSVPIGSQQLKLTPCLLARIFRREITDWNHAEIKDLNPDWEFATSFPISVARRVRGSSSTSAITNFLHMACPEKWPQSMVGAALDNWDSETLPCEGSGGVTNCIRENLGAIGYIDSGHGIAERLSEVSIQNKDGTFLTSTEAAKEGGIASAASAESAGFPDAVDQDFSSVQLLYQDGKYTWPMVLVTYLYVRKDLPSFIPNPAAQTLLIAFIQALYRDDYISECESEFGFYRVTGSLYEKSIEGISMLQTSDGAPTWSFENVTDPRTGQSDYVFSFKRESYSEVEQDSIVDTVARLETQIADLRAQNILLQSTVTTLEEDQGAHSHNTDPSSVSQASSFEADDVLEFTEGDATQLKAAVVLSSLSFVMSLFALLYLMFRGRGGA